ncbi:MAG: DMT family transporter [Alphaproteobacteria bacterium]
MRGALFMTLSMAGGAVSDAMVKAIAEHMGMAQIMFLRGIAATLLILLLAHQRRALRPLSAAAHPMIVLRSLGEVGATVTFLIALSRIPLADVSAILQALPLAVTLGAALFLGEPVGWRRWTAIAVGFAGVLVVVRPGAGGFTVEALLMLACVAFAALRDLTTRRVPGEIPALFISAVTAASVCATGGILVAATGDWRPVSALSAGMLVGAAVLLLTSYQLIILAMREGDISAVAPFRYTNLPCAILLGWLVFAEVPDAWMLSGSAIIIASGLYTFYRERRVARQPLAAAPPGVS